MGDRHGGSLSSIISPSSPTEALRMCLSSQSQQNKHPQNEADASHTVLDLVAGDISCSTLQRPESGALIAAELGLAQ